MDRRSVLALLVWGGVPTLADATTLSKLQKPDRATYFALEQDHVRVTARGLFKVKWVEGLRAGRYEAVAQDAAGIYYSGSGASVIVLSQKFADKYLANGEIPPFVDGTGTVGGREPGVGGLFIPSDLAQEPPKLFYTLKLPSLVNGGGIVAGVISSIYDGTLGYVNYQTEKDFVSSLKILQS